eukprot:UN04918
MLHIMNIPTQDWYSFDEFTINEFVENITAVVMKRCDEVDFGEYDDDDINIGEMAVNQFVKLAQKSVNKGVFRTTKVKELYDIMTSKLSEFCDEKKENESESEKDVHDEEIKATILALFDCDDEDGLSSIT